MKFPLLVLAAALPLVLAGCGGDQTPSARPATPTTSLVPAMPIGALQGRLVAVGGPAGSEDTTWPGELNIAARNGTNLKAAIGEDGRYAINLPPGRYRITATSPNYLEGKGVCRTDPVVTVLKADATITADVLCQRD